MRIKKNVYAVVYQGKKLDSLWRTMNDANRRAKNLEHELISKGSTDTRAAVEKKEVKEW